MSEAGKTSFYVGTAIVLAIVAYVARPRSTPVKIEEIVGKPLFKEFEDPLTVQTMKIVRYDEDLAETREFKVTKNIQTGVWTIPSHADYPADAENRIRDAATIFIGLKVLGIVPADASQHALYGVVEPDESNIKKFGDKGVGLLVRFDTEKNKVFSLIIGKKVKDAEGQRFVRVPGQEVFYVVKIDPDKLSTKFEDWIEKDLLKLNTWDVERIRVKDYSLVQTMQGTMLEPRFELCTSYNSTDSKWELSEFLTYRGRETVPAKLLETEELNKQKLDDLKSALGDLKIVDVRRKPKGLTADLQAGEEFMKDPDNQQSLVSRGFYPHATGRNQYELLAANGEVHVGMKDGVEYILRFGNTAGTGEGKDKDKLNRYLLVMARVDESRLPRPQLEELPPEPKSAGESKSPPADATNPADSKPPADKASQPGNGASEGNGEEKKEAAKPETSPPPKPDAPAKPASGGSAPSKPAADNSEAGAVPATKPEPADKAPPPHKEPEKAKDGKPTEEQEAKKPEKPSAGEPPAKPSPADEKKKKLDEERERITKENQRKLDEWNEKKKKATSKVRELNSRFADWYYVISEDVYKKIRLGRSDLIKETDKAKEEGFGIDAFRKLQEEGPDKKKADDSQKDDSSKNN